MRSPLKPSHRFRILKRDGFVCQYCGRSAPFVVLHVDHILPVKDGGTNDDENLISSCSGCNLGKGVKHLDVLPGATVLDVEERRKKIAEARERMRIASEESEYKKDMSRRLMDYWMERCEITKDDECFYPIDDYMESVRKFLGLLPPQEILEAMDISIGRGMTYHDSRFRYFCGVCWTKIRCAKEAKEERKQAVCT